MELLKGEEYWQVQPRPACCVKFRNDAGEKAFINVCTCSELPHPRYLTEEELIAVLQSNVEFRIPLSVSDVHYEFDKAGKQCMVFDVIVNDEFYRNKIKTSEVFKTYFIMVAVDAIEQKLHVKLDRNNWVLLRNRKLMGSVVPQNIKVKPRPVIEELDGDQQRPTSSPNKRRQVRAHNIVPLHSLEVNDDKCPTVLTAKFTLMGIKSSDEISLNMGSTRIQFTASNKYGFDAILPLKMDPERANVEFRVADELLVIVVPVARKRSDIGGD